MTTIRLGLRARTDPACTVTLVHGTFAESSEWIEPESQFSAALSEGQPIQVLPFRWSGANSAAARREAVRQLISALEQTSTAYPDSHHFVVGHSHGGGIALAACLDDSIRHAISGVACLSTPFVRFSERPEDSRLVAICGAVAVVAVAGWIALLAHQVVGGSSPLALLLPASTFAVTSLVLALIVRRSQQHARQFLREQADPHRGNANVLILRNSADEASAGMAAAQIVSWLTHRLWRALHHSRTLVTGVTHVEVPDPDLPTLIPRERDPIETTGIALLWLAGRAISLAMMLTTLVIGAAVIGPLVVLLSLFATTFGVRSVLAGLVLSMSVEPTPPGTWEIQQLDIQGDDEDVLRHSALISTTVARRVLRPWIIRTQERRALCVALATPAFFQAQLTGSGARQHRFRPAGRGGSFGAHASAFSRTGSVMIVLESARNRTLYGRLDMTATDRLDAINFVLPLPGGEITEINVPSATVPFVASGAVTGPPDRLHFSYKETGKVFAGIDRSCVMSFDGCLLDDTITGTLTETTTYRGTNGRAYIESSVTFTAELTLARCEAPTPSPDIGPTVT